MSEEGSEIKVSTDTPSQVHESWFKSQLKKLDERIPWKPGLDLKEKTQPNQTPPVWVFYSLMADMANTAEKFEFPTVVHIREMVEKGVNTMAELIAIGGPLNNLEATPASIINELSKHSMFPTTDFLQTASEFINHPSQTIIENINLLLPQLLETYEKSFYLGGRIALDLVAIGLIFTYINKDFIEAKILEMKSSHGSSDNQSVSLSPDLFKALGEVKKGYK